MQFPQGRFVYLPQVLMPQPVVQLGNFGLKIPAKLIPETWKRYMEDTETKRDLSRLKRRDTFAIGCIAFELLECKKPGPGKAYASVLMDFGSEGRYFGPFKAVKLTQPY